MARKRLPMELISNKKARLTSFEKRKESLKKAAYELSTLCGVDVGMIVCNDEHNEAEVWPPNPDTIARMIKLYKSGSDQDGMYNRTYGVSDYFKEKRERVEEQIKKMREKTREGKYATWDEECKSFSEDQLRELGKILKAKIGAVREKISSMQEYMGSLGGSRNLCPETKFGMNPLVQERVSLIPDFVQEQQILAYNDSNNNLGDLVEGSRNPYLKSKFINLQESEIYMPEIVRQHQHQHLARYEARNSIGNQNGKMMTMLMMNSDSASCSQGIVNYTYFLNHNCFQNWGMQMEIMEEIGIREVEPLMSYQIPNEEMMLQNWQGLMSMSAFPEMQAHQEGYYVEK